MYNKSNTSTRFLQRYEYEMTCVDILFPIIPTTVINNNNDSIICEGFVLGDDYPTLPDMARRSIPNHWALQDSNTLSHINAQWLIVGLKQGDLQCICDGL